MHNLYCIWRQNFTFHVEKKKIIRNKWQSVSRHTAHAFPYANVMHWVLKHQVQVNYWHNIRSHMDYGTNNQHQEFQVRNNKLVVFMVQPWQSHLLCGPCSGRNLCGNVRSMLQAFSVNCFHTDNHCLTPESSYESMFPLWPLSFSFSLPLFRIEVNQ